MYIVTEQYLNSILDAVASECKFINWTYEKACLNEIGQNYFGVIMPVTLTAKKGTRESSLPLIIKLAPTDEKFRITGAMALMFAREVYVYSVIFRKFLEIQQNLSCYQFIIPNCYYVCDEYCKEVVVLENMCSKGYKPYLSNMFLDLDHTIVSVKCIANFHALSFILKKEDEILFAEMTSVCKPLSENTNKRFMEILRDRLMKVMNLFDNAQDHAKLQSMYDDCARLVELVGDPQLVEQTVICHGDIWKENIMYKYENDKPISACLLDYQTARVSSPAFDFLYLITVSCESQLRRNHMKILTKIYYDTLLEVVSRANLDIKLTYSHEDLNNDLKTVAPACFIVANTALWLFSGHVRSKNPYVDEEGKLRALHSHKKVIKSIIDDFDTFGYF